MVIGRFGIEVGGGSSKYWKDGRSSTTRYHDAQSGAVALSLPPNRFAQTKPGKYHLRYAPHLTILNKELTIPQRLDLIAEHRFDATEYNGLLNHPLNEVEEIRKKLDSLRIEMGIFVAGPGWMEDGRSG